MTNYLPGDIVLLTFPFVEGTQTKNRPGLVILDTGNGDVVLARITTQNYQTPYDIEIIHWQESGLLAPSIVRLHKLVTIEKTLINRSLGKLHSTDRARVFLITHQIYEKIYTEQSK